MIRLGQFFRSFRHAARGLVIVYRHEQSFRIQVFAAILVALCAVGFGVTMTEWIVLSLLAGSVLGLEVINSILERIVDTFKPRIHPVVRDIKDMMAGVVLIVSLLSIIVGLMIFWPYVDARFL